MQRIFAALIFFTRLPLWRVVTVDQRHYARVVELWPLIGWLTGGLMALTFWAASMVFEPLCAATLAILSRTLLTGALHEDGLADFCDGMGGGTSRDRILAIMKDSHIGTYGVIGLIFYYALTIFAVSSLPVGCACLLLIAGDSWSKFCASQIINMLPYARTAEQAKNRTVYTRFTPAAEIIAIIIGAAPLALLPYPMQWAAAAPMVASGLIFMLLHRKIGGYTGDCCGAVFLISELAFYLTAAALQHAYAG